MGMAASQARYLALVARKSNCEYEGQQINQSRLNLANESSKLFNQMLGLSVPTPPSVQDFTKTQYSFTDGINPSVIDKWEQLANPDAKGNNYVVEYHYEANVYKGFEKRMNDPQIQFAYNIPVSSDISYERAQVREIYNAQQAIKAAQDKYDNLNADYEYWKTKVAKLATYRDAQTLQNQAQITDHTTNGYTVFSAADRSATAGEYLSYNIIGEKTKVGDASLWYDEATGQVYKGYAAGRKAIEPGQKLYCNSADKTGQLTIYSTHNNDGITPNYELTSGDLSSYYFNGADGAYTISNDPSTALTLYGDADTKTQLEDYIKTWRANGVEIDEDDIFYDIANDRIALRSDLNELNGVDVGLMKTLYIYNPTGVHNEADPYQSIESANQFLSDKKLAAANAYAELKNAEGNFEELNVPTFVGNTKLTSLSELTQEQMAEIKQVISDMTANGSNCNFLRCFTNTLNIDANNYVGGIYQFERDGVTYYTTYYDLADTATATTFTNDIDNQPKLSYYHANYITDNIYTTDKAILDTDARGRFKSVRFSDTGMTYTLNFEQVTDEEAYNDAMNQYYYKNARYDKMIQDINAKTSLIHQQDQELELRLKQLDTEQNALKNEIDAVSKVVKDNVEASFKTFGG